MASKIYTKTGDKGKTSLLGGKKVSKSSERINAYGTIDELNAFIGYLKDHEGVEMRLKQQLYWIQEHLFSLGSLLSAGNDFKGFDLPQITQIEITQLEQWIDHYDSKLPPLKNFILPGGHPAVSLCHVCRTICRRGERQVIELSEKEAVEANIIAFLNRLSDYFFILARKIAFDLDVPETPWVPEK